MFLVGIDDVGGIGEEWNLLQHSIAEVAVLLHDIFLFGIERIRLAEDGVRDRHFSDIVQEGTAGENAQGSADRAPWRARSGW